LRILGRRPHSVFADQLFDAALQLAFFLLALAQPLLEIGDGELGWGPPVNATPMKLLRHQMILARKDRPFRAMVSDIRPLGSLTELLNSRLAPRLEMLRTTQSVVVPRSSILATPPKITLSRTLWRRSNSNVLPDY
jgi:hypothetical protein